MFSLIETIDHALFWGINRTLSHSALDDFFLGLSWMGGWTVSLITLTLLGTEGRRRLLRHLLVLAVFFALTATINTHLKKVIGRARPTVVFETAPADEAGPWLRVLEWDPPRRNSFPSGHSMAAFFLLVYAARQHRSFRPWLLLLATGIAISRVYVGVHFPLDCLAGSGIGASGALLASAVFRRVYENAAAHE